MLEKGFILHHPLGKLTGCESEEIMPEGSFGAVMARAGVGKTALLIQLAIHSLLCNKNVLHISLNDPVKKVGLWYKEVFRNIALQYSLADQEQIFEDMLPHRFIMTFEVEGFSVPKLEERLTDLMEQNIFRPHLIFIDGLPFDESQREPLSDLKTFVENNSLKAWFTVRIHREDTMGPGGLPAQINDVNDLFDTVISIQPEGKEINLKALKGVRSASSVNGLLLNPTTMLIQENNWIRHS
ncbi:MAG: cytoplasmic protein [Desulfobacteraceae bacterium]|nr:MAG: cytoplasmic protein [Desulfobacteraceae bacterium]